jgi:NitT/TauT family transport system permease protein
MGTLWSIVIAVADGIRSIPPLFVQAARTMGASGTALLCKVTLPASLPIVLSGMRQGWAFAWRSLLAAEIFVTILSGFGLGHLLHYGRELHAMDQVFGIMALILGVGLATEALLFGALQTQIKRRWGFAS